MGEDEEYIQGKDGFEITAWTLAGMDQYNFITTLSRTVTSKTFLAEKRSNHQLYSIKQYNKKTLVDNDEVKGVIIEKNIFMKARKQNQPFIARLFETFQTDDSLFFVMEHLPGGDLTWHLTNGEIGIERAKFYTSELCLALKWLHENGILHRDLKLEHISLTSDGHIALTSFNFAAEGVSDRYGTRKTFCGTAEFMAPEILLDNPYGRPADWWAFGILLYQLLTHQSPFLGHDEDEIYDAILSDEPIYPQHIHPTAQDLISKLLIKAPEKRIGHHKGAEEIMQHPFFENVDWEALLRKEVKPPWKPVFEGERDLRYFDEEFTKLRSEIGSVGGAPIPPSQNPFQDF